MPRRLAWLGRFSRDTYMPAPAGCVRVIPAHARGGFGIVQIGCGETVDLQCEAVVLVGLADPLHSDAPCGRDTAGVARAHDGEHLRYPVGESLMRHCVTSLSAVTVSPCRRGDLPTDFEVGAAGRQRQQGDRSDDQAAVTDLDRPVAQRPPGFVVLVIHRASSCRISSRSATRGIAGASQRATCVRRKSPVPRRRRQPSTGATAVAW